MTVPSFFQGPAQYSYSKDATEVTHWSLRFKVYKLAFDLTATATGLALTLVVACLLLVLNPVFNPGPLFFRQERLGKNKRRFVMWKFRTMVPATPATTRIAAGALEVERITPLGQVLRKFRIDELPNFINVLRGEMSVIGPRPESADHAEVYSQAIDHYDYRFKVKPGITGLAQVEAGYAEGVEATAVKAHYDKIYVETSSGRLDLYIAFRTMRVMYTGFGAR